MNDMFVLVLNCILLCRYVAEFVCDELALVTEYYSHYDIEV
jgi:hypothetical protein